MREPDDILDELQVLEIQGGQLDALPPLIRRWQPRLARLAWRLTGDRDAAGDIMQETWLAIVRGIRGLDDPSRFRSWACRIVARRCADWVRRRRQDRRAADHLADRTSARPPPVHDGEEACDEVRRLREALSGLPSDQRAVLTLHYLEGMKLEEIAGVLGIPAGTVKSRLFHAREQLRRVLEEG